MAIRPAAKSSRFVILLFVAAAVLWIIGLRTPASAHRDQSRAPERDAKRRESGAWGI